MSGATLPEWEMLISQRDAAQDLAARRKAEADDLAAKVARVQDVLDDAWIRLPPDAEEALREAIA